MSEKIFTISEAAKELQLETHVLRYWEEELNIKVPRNDMGHRIYTPREMDLFRTILKLKQEGFQLRAIKLILADLKEGEHLNFEQLIRMRDEINQKVEQLHNVYSFPKETLKTEQEPDHLYALESSKPRNSLYQKEAPIKPTSSTPLSVERTNQFQYIMMQIMNQAFADHTNQIIDSLKMELSNYLTLGITDQITNGVMHGIKTEINQGLKQDISEEVSTRVLKEMNYLAREQEEAQEQYFEKLDQRLREAQNRKKKSFGFRHGKKEVAASKK